MSVTENDVRNAYRFVLGREPESADVIQFWKAHADSWPELRQYFLQSEEYKIKNPVPTAKKSASHEDFYLKNCGEDFFWCIRSDGDDNVSQAIKTTGRWEETEELKTIAQRLRNNNKSGGVLLDLGANIGAISVPFAKTGWHVISVEAGSRNVGALRITSKLNDLDIEVLPYIVHRETRKMQFYQNGPWGFITSEIMNLPGAELLDAFKLDDLERAAGHDVNRIDLVKIDIEGSEVAAVEGGSQFFRRYHYPPCFCEANRWTLMAQGENVYTLKEAFAKQGYKPYVFRDGKLVQVLDPEHEIATIVNYYFVHDDVVSHEIVADETIRIADNDYEDRVCTYIEKNQSWFDSCCKASNLVVIRQSPALMENAKLKAYADQLENELCEDDVLAKAIDQCYEQIARRKRTE